MGKGKNLHLLLMVVSPQYQSLLCGGAACRWRAETDVDDSYTGQSERKPLPLTNSKNEIHTKYFFAKCMGHV